MWICAGPDAIRGLQATARRLQSDVDAFKADSRLDKFRQLQADLRVRGKAGSDNPGSCWRGGGTGYVPWCPLAQAGPWGMLSCCCCRRLQVVGGPAVWQVPTHCMAPWYKAALVVAVWYRLVWWLQGSAVDAVR